MTGALFLQEERELEIDVRASRESQPRGEFAEDRVDVIHVQLGAEFVEHLDEAAHVRAFEVMRQIHRERDRGDGVLDLRAPCRGPASGSAAPSRPRGRWGCGGESRCDLRVFEAGSGRGLHESVNIE